MREIRNKNLSQNKLKGSDPKTKRKCQKAEKKGFIMKKTNGYTINPADNTITLTKAYAKLAYTPGTKEFRELSSILKAYPNMTVAMRSATKNEDKEKHSGLTVARMEFIIKNYVGDEIALAEFKEVQKFYKGMNGYYGKVKGWFLAKYPNYQQIDFADVATSQKSENADLRIAG